MSNEDIVDPTKLTKEQRIAQHAQRVEQEQIVDEFREEVFDDGNLSEKDLERKLQELRNKRKVAEQQLAIKSNPEFKDVDTKIQNLITDLKKLGKRKADALQSQFNKKFRTQDLADAERSKAQQEIAKKEKQLAELDAKRATLVSELTALRAGTKPISTDTSAEEKIMRECDEKETELRLEIEGLVKRVEKIGEDIGVDVSTYVDQCRRFENPSISTPAATNTSWPAEWFDVQGEKTWRWWQIRLQSMGVRFNSNRVQPELKFDAEGARKALASCAITWRR